jgi:hypothetical protein
VLHARLLGVQAAGGVADEHGGFVEERADLEGARAMARWIRALRPRRGWLGAGARGRLGEAAGWGPGGAKRGPAARPPMAARPPAGGALITLCHHPRSAAPPARPHAAPGPAAWGRAPGPIRGPRARPVLRPSRARFVALAHGGAPPWLLRSPDARGAEPVAAPRTAAAESPAAPPAPAPPGADPPRPARPAPTRAHPDPRHHPPPGPPAPLPNPPTRNAPHATRAASPARRRRPFVTARRTSSRSAASSWTRS